MKTILSHAATNEHRIEVGTGYAILTQQTQFDFSREQMDVLVQIMREVRTDEATRHTYTDHTYNVEYEPGERDLIITRRSTGRTITVALSGAYKLLDALTGETEQIAREDK